jgi:hypothetical protein
MTILRRALAVSKRNFRVCILSFAQSLSVGNTHGGREPDGGPPARYKADRHRRNRRGKLKEYEKPPKKNSAI